MINLTTKVKKQITVRGKVAKLLVLRNTEFPGYYVTKCGKIYSVKNKGRPTFNYANPKRLKTMTRGMLGYEGLGISRNKNIILKKQNGWENPNIKIVGLFVHVAVMHTWRPLEKYTYKLGISSKTFNKLPNIVKTLIRNSVTINHIDHDKFNNHVNNLEYCTDAQNAVAAKEFYKKKS